MSVSREFTPEHAFDASEELRALSPTTRARALDSWRAGDVESVERHAGRFVARVRGAPPRTVRGDHLDDLGCTCPRYVRCEHIGAVLLAITALGAGRAQGGAATRGEARALDGARAWAARLDAHVIDVTGQTARFAFVLQTPSGFPPRVVLARQQRSADGEAWSDPTLLSAAEARQVLRRDTGDELIDDVVARATWHSPTALLRGRRGAALLEAALDSGRLWWGERVPLIHLQRGDPLDVRLSWRTHGDQHHPSVALPGEHQVLVRLVPSFLIDSSTGEVHVADAGGGPSRIDVWLAGPALSDDDLDDVGALLPAGVPKPRAKERVAVRPPLRARLRLVESAMPAWVDRRAELRLTYDDVGVHPEDLTDPVLVRGDERDREIWRDTKREAEIVDAIAREGFFDRQFTRFSEHRITLSLGDDAAWIAFLLEGAPRLRERGVEIEIDPSFTLEIVDIEGWDVAIEPENDWFGVEIGIRVKGERVSLLPLLVKAFDRPANRAAAEILVELPGGKRARVPRARIEPLVDLIMELAASGNADRPRLSRLHAADLAHALRLESATLASLRALRETLASASFTKLVAQPKKLRAKMRDYQRVGLSWLALLASHGLGGILADDMGLGKTLQVIALICLFAQRRGDRAPALVVAPRSVLLSWTDQLVAFAPHLRIRVWHGGDRRTWGTEFAGSDVVVTTYQLLHRDVDLLSKQRWSLAVLDEAQVIKNAKSVFATSAMKLDAGVRFALTGTPLENHLGELWSITRFVAPGTFGDDRTFRAAFRNPIEREHDATRLAALRRRLAPILLRRTKEQVAAELPPKTIVTHRVELDDEQRDLYEAVRQMAAKRVREEIARRGIAQARIVVLDALLKLRQVCCDPRLLKSRTAKSSVASAKVEAFEELLTTLVEEGRRVLVFSQFVEMLDLLEPVLSAHGIERARITGATRDREREVRRFQAGEVPVFLISLKAGGTGLNLTAADSVIHYDPWWNPAVEAQATDRAHRIGQDKPVFVHRLLTVGTIEEKIAALQEKKSALARGVLDGGASVFELDESTIDELLAPLRS
ncbi:MAG: DEAD/DEAH box helicase [Polyangiaceae bacterium]